MYLKDSQSCEALDEEPPLVESWPLLNSFHELLREVPLQPLLHREVVPIAPDNQVQQKLLVIKLCAILPQLLEQLRGLLGVHAVQGADVLIKFLLKLVLE